VHDPVDIRRRIDRLARRVDRRSDYGRLLARGDVFHRVEDLDDIEAWRSEIKRQARADRIKVRTGANEHIVCAYVAGGLAAERENEAHRYTDLMRRAVPLAVEHRHEPSVLLRDGEEVICKCGRCSALGYADATDDVIGGELFDDECPNEAPPTHTNLAFSYYGRPPQG
jgi:hypothetical protein